MRDDVFMGATMLLTLLFIIQTLFAQNDRRPLPQQNYNPRNATVPAKNDILTDVCKFTNYGEINVCVSNYEAKNVLFNPTSLAVCKDAHFTLMSDKQKCVEQAKGRIFNISNLNDCLDKGHDGKRGIMPPKIVVYEDCMKDKNNLAEPTAAKNPSGSR